MDPFNVVVPGTGVVVVSPRSPRVVVCVQPEPVVTLRLTPILIQGQPVGVGFSDVFVDVFID